MAGGLGFSHFFPEQKKCDVHSAVECEHAVALELMDAGALSGGRVPVRSGRLDGAVPFSRSWAGLAGKGSQRGDRMRLPGGADEEFLLKYGVPARGCTVSTHTYAASTGRFWPAWGIRSSSKGGEGSDLPPFHFTPGLDLDASNKFEEEGHKMEEVDKGVQGG